MFSVVDTIRNIVGDDNYYLIGIDQSDGEDPSLIFHEVAHGLWFSSSIYKRKQFNMKKNLSKLNFSYDLAGLNTYVDALNSDIISEVLPCYMWYCLQK